MVRQGTDPMAPHSDQLQLNVKITAHPPPDDLLRAIETTPGVTLAEPLFPGEEHPELAKLYVVYVEQSAANVVVLTLRDLPEIEYVEVPKPRKLIRPRKKRAVSAGSRRG